MAHTLNEFASAHERKAVDLEDLQAQFQSFREAAQAELENYARRMSAAESSINGLADEILALKTSPALSTPAAPAPAPIPATEPPIWGGDTVTYDTNPPSIVPGYDADQTSEPAPLPPPMPPNPPPAVDPVR